MTMNGANLLFSEGWIGEISSIRDAPGASLPCLKCVGSQSLRVKTFSYDEKEFVFTRRI